MIQPVVIGINHRTAPLGLRERFALDVAAQHRVRTALRGARPALDDVAILSTCNRTEIILAGEDGAAMRSVVLAAVAAEAGVLPAAADGVAYMHQGPAAVRHLCRVAAGLDSLVVGEAEILGQLNRARRLAQPPHPAASVVDAALRTALRAGRRARAETEVGRHPASVAAEAVRLAQHALGPLETRRVLVIGTGAMARQVLRLVSAHRPAALSITGRSDERAGTLASGAGVVPWGERGLAVCGVDLVISATAAPSYVLTPELLPPAPACTALLVDLAVPRDIDPRVASVTGATLVDMDGLEPRVRANLAVRAAAEGAVTAIIEEELARFAEWQREAGLRPLLTAIRTRSEVLRRRELERLRRRTRDLPPDVQQQFDEFSRALVNRLLDRPTRRLRELDDPETARLYQVAARELFGLGEAERS